MDPVTPHRQFYLKHCSQGVDSRTFSDVLRGVLENIKDPECPPDVKIAFGNWLFKRIFTVYKIRDRKEKETICQDLVSSVEECENLTIKGLYLQYQDVDATTNMALHFYFNRFQTPDRFFIIQLINDTQLVKNYVQSQFSLGSDACIRTGRFGGAKTSDEELKDHFLEWISRSDVVEQRSNILDVLLRYYPKDAEVKAVYEKMRWGDTSEKRWKTLYSDDQSAHDEEVSASVLEASEQLIEWGREHPVTFDEKHTIDQYLKKRLPKEALALGILERIAVDTTTFGSGFNIADVLVTLVHYIELSDNSKNLTSILMGELKEMSGWCSSAYISHLINVLQGQCEDFQISISEEKRLYAILSFKLSKELDEDTCLGSIDPSLRPKYLMSVRDIVNRHLVTIIEDHGEDDVEGSIVNVMVSLTGHKKWSYVSPKVVLDTVV